MEGGEGGVVGCGRDLGARVWLGLALNYDVENHGE